MRPLVPCLCLGLGLLPAAAPAEGLTVALSFSPRAAAELAARGEMVTVSAYWSGDPAPGATLPETGIGTILLLSETHTVGPLAQQVRLGTNLAAAPAGQLAALMVNVNVFTARLTDEDNLIDCGFLDAPAAALGTAPQPMACRLIGE